MPGSGSQRVCVRSVCVKSIFTAIAWRGTERAWWEESKAGAGAKGERPAGHQPRRQQGSKGSLEIRSCMQAPAPSYARHKCAPYIARRSAGAAARRGGRAAPLAAQSASRGQLPPLPTVPHHVRELAPQPAGPATGPGSCLGAITVQRPAASVPQPRPAAAAAVPNCLSGPLS